MCKAKSEQILLEKLTKHISLKNQHESRRKSIKKRYAANRFRSTSETIYINLSSIHF